MTPNGKLDRKALRTLPLPAAQPIRENRMKTKHPPLNVAEGELSRLWRQILGDVVGGASIQAETDFFAIGGSSLQLVRLQNALRERMGVEASLHDIYRLSSLGKMAALMCDERGRLESDAIDWSAETDIPHVQTVIETAAVSNVSDHQFEITGTLRQKKEVVLTGATGFLGSEILKGAIA
ncbi:hypothetical protein AN6961.2 [Aspergillus nidulans FGSC A4]|jgi:acyl carrier protein|uniref:NRPS-like enzyme, putative (JCVI) n=1 Tax=Emericella nidulans (strain FGSC A4 / ATCC 38163 / CBS 112.46 / NRRL 194 / M139) TaxID=227321 RepID=Q5AXL9_EMENI|nr:hypothetical protein [Aspergillus nidulans FGSC A4]EAA57603.1 hypothetical protein AN6961.2 [Aspergillus nidulans FGSC A4]CBF71839.1 TPA: NRPS-like enzyme, putative (JCVI) [Aspergillus nidulans FGSC A4]|eukprot:XP_664565.1 hypothetical protein AN6961.2 [Aspergillus nidulans FGSC A4]